VVSVLVSLLHSLRWVVARSRASLHLEIIALRPQLGVVNRLRRPRLRITRVDRMLWAWLSRSWHGWRSAVHIVKPEPSSRGTGAAFVSSGPGRVDTERADRLCHTRFAASFDLSTANTLCGAPRIHGELQKLGILASQSTVAKYMRSTSAPAVTNVAHLPHEPRNIPDHVP
jgi:hypothetical protein